MMGKMLAISALAMLIGAPALAQDTMAPAAPPATDTMTPAAPPATDAMAPATPATGAPMPKCSAKITDSCDQSKTTERYALTAEQAEKTGGVGDRAENRRAPAKTSMHKKSMHKKSAAHHTAKKAATTTTTATQLAPQ